MKRCRIPNVFFDTTTMPSQRFPNATADQLAGDLIEAVKEVDDVMCGLGINKPPQLRPSNQAPRGEIYVNLVDLMERVCAEVDGSMSDVAGKAELEKLFERLKNNDAFTSRVRGILYEEGKGLAQSSDYAAVAAWLRNSFKSEDGYRILTHAHGGQGVENHAVLQAVQAGADGVWASFIPQAAQSGHSSSFMFLDNMIINGNKGAWDSFRLHHATEAAKMLYMLNFNTIEFPGECPIWGTKTTELVHSAFNKSTKKDWRERVANQYHQWKGVSGSKALVELGNQKEGIHELEANRTKVFDSGNENRIAPVVSDPVNIGKRLEELGLLSFKKQEKPESTGPEMQWVMMAIMNAGVRINFNDKRRLELLMKEIRWKRSGGSSA